jgi:uncharacterized membrane protein YdjX (TVP38/TMEM64 family)
MNVGRQRFVARLERWISAGRLRIVFPYVSADDAKVPVKVHAKLIIVDDSSIELGSANLNNRSMSVDTETDVVIVARTDRERGAVASVRHALMAEHLGVEPSELERREAECGSFLEVIDSVRSDARGLAPISIDDAPENLLATALAQVADPEQPLDPEQFIGDLFGGRRVRPMLRRASRLLALAAVLIALVLVWHMSSLSEWFAVDRVASLLDTLSTSAWGGPITLLIFVFSNIVIFPVSVLIAATAIAFGAGYGFLWALAGSMLSAIATFGVGRWLGRPVLDKIESERANAVAERLARGGLITVFVMRNVPIAPFTVVNFAAGASAIRFGDYVLGTLLGMGPGIAALIFLGDQLRNVWEHPSAGNIMYLVAAIAAWITLVLGLQSLSNRLARKRREG